LVEEAGMADTPWLDELYDAAYRRLVVQLYAICGDLNDAEDAVQEAFVIALRKQRDFRKVANPEAWIRTAALNRPPA
jgi:RNA polymerase sigma-70 factor (ECF subfamily)